MTRYRTTGQSTPWIVHPGYRHQSKQWARLERPAGEPSLTMLWLSCLPILSLLALAWVMTK